MTNMGCTLLLFRTCVVVRNRAPTTGCSQEDEIDKRAFYCKCDNLEVPFAAGGVAFVKRRRADKEETVLRRGRWKTGTMHKAWRYFLANRLYLDKHSVETIRRVQDPERIEEINNFWK